MKKYLAAALALAGIIACNKVEITGPQANPEIAFADSFVEIKTRTAEDPSITTGTITAFDAWSFMDDTKALILNKERVTKVNDAWEYKNLQYWLPSHTYYFGAIAPVDHTNISVSTTDANKHGLGTVTFTNLDGTDDLIYASKSVTTGADVINNAPGKISLQFAHLLSKVKFTFVNGFSTENATLAVRNIKMIVPKAGTITLAQESWWTKDSWTMTEDGLTLDFGSVNGGNVLAATKGDECAYERLTIPTDDKYTYTITFDVALYMGTYETPAYTTTRTVTLTGQALKIGKNYYFKTVIGPENIHPDGPLKPIEFDVITVNSWEEGTAATIL